ncbi:hypothetical protein [Caulobacter sp. NIBR1757]|uniref:hypothetical protein n=1 Tax=Caulobacter sp. NIBR1757 TaxID=3016000 RepID=UPI0022F041A2|nr:hypothetical protein [Caulobacter sp. NIBR1757]WGM40199.1 hypothetical protein AMEJIAPC_03140 [Caulobacter sp. NIBR1757]
MIVIALSLMLASTDGPPPYPRALACAGLTMAWSDLEAENSSAGAKLARSDAEFWAFAAMDAARRDGGMKPPQVEAAMARATQGSRARFQANDENAARELLDCQMLIPKEGRGIEPVGD